jgi:hypothetical protein
MKIRSEVQAEFEDLQDLHRILTALRSQDIAPALQYVLYCIRKKSDS